MAIEEFGALESLLERMRAIHGEMSGYHGGISLLHLEAAVASLESHLNRERLASAALVGDRGNDVRRRLLIDAAP